MELTHSRSTDEHSLDIDGQARVSETIELDEREQERIVQSLANGDMMDMSERAVWEELKDRGTVTKRVEEESGEGLGDLFG